MPKPTTSNKTDGTRAGEIIVGGKLADVINSSAPAIDPDGRGADEDDVLQGATATTRSIWTVATTPPSLTTTRPRPTQTRRVVSVGEAQPL